MLTVALSFPCVPAQAAATTPSSRGQGLRRPAARTVQPLVASAVTDLSPLRSQRVVCILDGDNIRISAQERGAVVLYDRLLDRMRQIAADVFPVSVITREAGDGREEAALKGAGWRVLSIEREVVPSVHGPRKAANADSDVAFELGALAVVADPTLIVLGTGDGDLAVSCARGIGRVLRGRRVPVHTLSVPGSTSSRMRSRTDLFASSLLLGSDILVPTTSKRFALITGDRHAA